jgi:hypothetical protein
LKSDSFFLLKKHAVKTKKQEEASKQTNKQKHGGKTTT